MSDTEKTLKRMLINTRQSEEVRVALTEGNRLIDFDVESAHVQQKKDNIYLAKVSRVVPSLNACFVDYGSDKHGFLPLKDISAEYFPERVRSDQRSDIKYLIQEGQELLIQIKKEERGSKGAAVSTFISLAGCYLVLLPNNNGSGGISRQIEGGDRQHMKEALEQLEIPEGMSIILRTAGLGRDPEELKWDLQTLLTLWDNIKAAIIHQKPPSLIYKDSDVILRSIRDYLREDLDEIVVDTEDTYHRVLQNIKRIRHDSINRLKLYTQERALFSRYQIESQIESAYQREMTLPSGGSIVIDYTEALTAIDINSAKSTQGSDIEATALATNLEAAEEIARQARIRDFGGLIVIDFIDMLEPRNQRAVENHLANCIKRDRARVQLGHISRFGLLEMSRQRLRPSIGEQSNITCPRCDGLGRIRGLQSIAVSLIRLLEEEALKNKVVELQLQLPVNLSTYLLNEKRGKLRDIENQNDIRIILIPNPNLETPHYKLTTLQEGGEATETSYDNLIQAKEADASILLSSTRTHIVEEPVVKTIEMSDAPIKKTEKPSLLKRLWNDVFGSNDARMVASTPAASEPTAIEKNQASRFTRPRHHHGRRSDRLDDNENANQSRTSRKDEPRRSRTDQGNMNDDRREKEGREKRDYHPHDRREPRDKRDHRDRREKREPRESTQSDAPQQHVQQSTEESRPRKKENHARQTAPRKNDTRKMLSVSDQTQPLKAAITTMIIKTSDQVLRILENNQSLKSRVDAHVVESRLSTLDLPPKISYQFAVEPTLVDPQFVAEARAHLQNTKGNFVESQLQYSTLNKPVHISIERISM